MTSQQPANQRVTIAEGHYLTRQGDEGDRAWLIEDGTLEVLLTTADGTRKLGVIGKGAVVGEMALIDGAPRSASVVATSTVRAVELSRVAFRQMLDRCEPLAYYLLTSLIAAIRRSYGLKEMGDANTDFGIRSVKSPQKILDRRSFEKNHVFFRQGERGNAAYLIQSGGVAIVRKGDNGETTVLARLGPGRIFGELALLSGRPRAASAIAEQTTICEVITRESFSKAVMSLPPILRAIIRIYVEQLGGPMTLRPALGVTKTADDKQDADAGGQSA